jgi:hypothetical protein
MQDRVRVAVLRVLVAVIDLVGVEGRSPSRMIPWISWPFFCSNAARYEPSCPMSPVGALWFTLTSRRISCDPECEPNRIVGSGVSSACVPEPKQGIRQSASPKEAWYLWNDNAVSNHGDGRSPRGIQVCRGGPIDALSPERALLEPATSTYSETHAVHVYNVYTHRYNVYTHRHLPSTDRHIRTLSTRRTATSPKGSRWPLLRGRPTPPR